MGVRRKRIKPEQPAKFWDELARLPIASEPALTPVEAKAVLALSEKHGLTVYDAVYLACHEKLADEAGRKALIILTDAQDEGSRLHVQDAIEAAQRTDTVIHILLIGDPQNFSVNEGVAKKLTEETGGRTIVVRNEKKLEEAFQEISEELRSQYTLGYYSTNPARDGSYRKIKVETMQKDLDVLTRRGYYASKN